MLGHPLQCPDGVTSGRFGKGCRRLEGGFSFVMMDDAHLIGVRDRHGIWPLVLGRIEGGWVLASETCALDIVGAHFVREVEPGEVLVIDASGVHSLRFAEPDPKLCLFEFVYFARPDTMLYGRNAHAARQRMGEELARQAPVSADMVMPVPSRAFLAQGYAVPGIPYGDGWSRTDTSGEPSFSRTRRSASRAYDSSSTRLRRTSAEVVVGSRIDRARHHVASARVDAAAGAAEGISGVVATLPVAVAGLDTGRRRSCLPPTCPSARSAISSVWTRSPTSTSTG
jgi:amidophosphoribosyltransferase